MPSSTIHICVALKIARKKKLKNEFIIGNIAPDSWRNNNEISRKKSHFSNRNEDYIAFFKKYKKNINNPFVLGYLTHLMTDFYYRNYTNDIIYNINGKKALLLLDGTYLKDDISLILHKNKTRLSNQLTSYFNLKKINYNGFDIPVEEVNKLALIKTINYINENEIINKVIPNDVFDFNLALKNIDKCSDFILKELDKLI